jgi:putative ABC transport system permease protein
LEAEIAMLYKIGWRSFLQQFRNYVVYFVCMMTAIMIFYSFSAMMNDRLLTQRVQQDTPIDGILGFGSTIVAIVVLFFMLSANHFFLNQRQKEISVYQLLGLRRAKLCWLLLRETFLLNLFSLFVGIFMGIIFSKFFSMILIRVMGLSITSHFFNSPRSILTTVWVFLLAMVILSGQVVLFVWQNPLNDLMKTNLTLPVYKLKPHPFRSAMGIVGLLLLGVGYYLALTLRTTLERYITYTEDYTAILWIPLLIFVCCVTATYLFFDCTLPMLLHLLTNSRKRVCKGTRLIAFNNVRAYLQRTWRSFSLLTIITAIAISLIGGTMGVISLNYQASNREYPTDFQVAADRAAELARIVQDHGQVTEEQKVTFRVLPVAINAKYLVNPKSTGKETFLVNVLSLSDYQAFRRLVPDAPEVSLSEGRGVFFDADYNIAYGLRTFQNSITLENGKKILLEKSYPDYFGDISLRYSLPNVLVVNDADFQKMSGMDYQLSYLNVNTADHESLSKAIDDQLPIEWAYPFSYKRLQENGKVKYLLQSGIPEKNPTAKDYLSGYRLNLANRYLSMRAVRRQGGIILFVSLFVGVIVLITTSSSLIVRQFSNTEREKRNYRLLSKLGYSKKEIRSIVYWQNFWVFLPGTVLAILHAGFAINTLTQFVVSPGYWVAHLFAGIAAAVFLIAYLITVKLCLRIIEE